MDHLILCNPLKWYTSETTLPKATRRTLAQLRTHKSAHAYMKSTKTTITTLSPLQNRNNAHHLFNCTITYRSYGPNQ